MRVYILGITGMLGSELFLRFSNISRYDVRGSTRKKYIKIFEKFKNNIDYNVSAYDLDKIQKRSPIYRGPFLVI